MAEPRPDYQVDLANCDKEPIHEIGAVQPHSMFCALLPDSGEICAVSENLAGLVNRPAEDLIGQDASTLVKADLDGLLAADPGERKAIAPFEVTLADKARYWAHPFWTGGVLALDLEPLSDNEVSGMIEKATSMLDVLRQIDDVEELTRRISHSVRDILGFDRTMVYQFDDEFNGTVIAEASNGGLEHSFLGLTFPHSDIPAQARALFVRNRVRAIPAITLDCHPIIPALNPLTGAPFDLSDSVIRSVSPIHIEYLENMGVRASLTISLLRKQELWGLIACHHYSSEKYVPPGLRRVCVVLCEAFSQRLAEVEANDRSADTMLKTQEINNLPKHNLAIDRGEGDARDSDNPLGFIERAKDDILRILGADGVRVEFDAHRADIGALPSDERIDLIVAAAWAARARGDHKTLVTDHLAAIGVPPSESCAGIIFDTLPTGNGFLLAVRREEPQAVTWAGDPNMKAHWDSGSQRLHPRASFEGYQELQRGRSAPWPPISADLAPELTRMLLWIFTTNTQLRELQLSNRVKELDEANDALDKFAHVISHDLSSPQRAISGFSKALVEDFGGELSEPARDYADRINKSAVRMGEMIDDLLKLSRETRGELDLGILDLSALVQAVADDTAHDGPNETELDIQPDVKAYGDERLMRIALENLIGNARRYSSREARPHIRFGTREVDGEQVYFIADNGVGFDMSQAHNLFQPFARLHADQGFAGTGMGLATVARIVERHGGRLWAEAAPDRGATFFFTLPGF